LSFGTWQLRRFRAPLMRTPLEPTHVERTGHRLVQGREKRRGRAAGVDEGEDAVTAANEGILPERTPYAKEPVGGAHRLAAGLSSLCDSAVAELEDCRRVRAVTTVTAIAAAPSQDAVVYPLSVGNVEPDGV
jgi:hypothetical protein